MKPVKILSVFAVFAAAGMVPAGCDSPAGVGNGYDETASAEESGSAGGTTALSASGTKTIKVKFEVLNGGGGLFRNGGSVSTQDDSCLVKDGKAFSRDFTIKITVPASDEYLNVRWQGDDCWQPDTYVKAKMKAKSGTITLDYNGPGKVATKNLYDVSITTESTGHGRRLR